MVMFPTCQSKWTTTVKRFVGRAGPFYSFSYRNNCNTRMLHIITIYVSSHDSQHRGHRRTQPAPDQTRARYSWRVTISNRRSQRVITPISTCVPFQPWRPQQQAAGLPPTAQQPQPPPPPPAHQHRQQHRQQEQQEVQAPAAAQVLVEAAVARIGVAVSRRPSPTPAYARRYVSTPYSHAVGENMTQHER